MSEAIIMLELSMKNIWNKLWHLPKRCSTSPSETKNGGPAWQTLIFIISYLYIWTTFILYTYIIHVNGYIMHNGYYLCITLGYTTMCPGDTCSSCPLETWWEQHTCKTIITLWTVSIYSYKISIFPLAIVIYSASIESHCRGLGWF